MCSDGAPMVVLIAVAREFALSIAPMVVAASASFENNKSWAKYGQVV